METSTLQFLWYVVLTASMFAYAALDGFDIGVGCLQIFARTDYDRRIFMNAIGPVWDSNALWVVITSGAMLSGFPTAFATLFSGLYLPMMGLIFGYIMRGVAIEFRSRLEGRLWRFAWDWVFSLASYALAFGYGVVLANIIHGLPIDHDGRLLNDHRQMLTPFSILLGVFTTSMFMLHGALYLNLKTADGLQERLRRWSWRLFGNFVLLWILVNISTPLAEKHVTELIRHQVLFYPLIFIGLVGVISLYCSLHYRYNGFAFISSAVIILSLIITYALGTYPNLVRSSINEAYSLTMYNASSTPLTLSILLGIAVAGVPLFVFYMIYSYRVFKGKVELDTMSY